MNRFNNKGVSLLEAMVSLALFGLVGLSLTGNTIYALKVNKFTEVNNTIHNLEMSKMEQFASEDPAALNDSFDEVENNVPAPGSNFTFTRTSDVTVNANSTRSVSVTVRCNDPRYASSKTYRATFAVWE